MTGCRNNEICLSGKINISVDILNIAGNMKYFLTKILRVATLLIDSSFIINAALADTNIFVYANTS